MQQLDKIIRIVCDAGAVSNRGRRVCVCVYSWTAMKPEHKWRNEAAVRETVKYSFGMIAMGWQDFSYTFPTLALYYNATATTR